MKKKLFIGITTSKRTVKVNFLKQDITYINDSFIDLLKSYDNIIPIILSPDTDPEHAKDIIQRLDGLILSSGEDIDPSLYNAKNEINYHENIEGAGTHYNRPISFAPNKQRDQFEINLYHAAKKNNIPILGICRGMQLINIAEGGTLHQELPETEFEHFLGKDGWIHYHNVTIERDTKLFDLFRIDSYPVSSIHHQAVDKLGENLIVSGKAEDGIVEIIEHLEHEFVVGVQGHIEKIIANFPLYNKLIEAFVHHANERSLVK